MSPSFATGAQPSTSDFEFVLPRFALKTADETVTNSAVLQDDDQLQVAVDANKTYRLSGFVRWTCASSTPDIQFAFSLPAGASLSWWGAGPHTDLTAQNSNLSVYAPDDTGVVWYGTNNSTTFPSAMIIAGLLIVGSTAGSLTLRWAQQTSNASGVTVKEKSYLELLRVA